MGEVFTDFDECKASTVNKEYKAGKRFNDIAVEDGIAPWLRLGLYHCQLLEEAGEEPVVTPEDIRDFDKQGGTDHLDPTLSHHHKDRDVY